MSSGKWVILKAVIYIPISVRVDLQQSVLVLKFEMILMHKRTFSINNSSIEIDKDFILIYFICN